MSEKTLEEVQAELKGKAILVANRGIPARRICRAIRERFSAIAVMTATDVDKTSPAASSAQELMLLGSDPTAYLDLDLIISKAKARGIVGIHPGWGFASEDDSFPRKCEESGITFIGSTCESMNLLGNKVQARNLAVRLGVPVVPGSDGAVDIEGARAVIRNIGLPVMLKAEGGGGGRGIFVIRTMHELEDAFVKASTMAEASFGNPRLFVERYLENVRHIEIQVIADKYGNIFAFDERDCTIQRNHQKLIEITPSPWPGMTEELRAQLKEYARRLVKAVNYYSVATVEFLVTQDGTPYMIEVNTRLQVEHGITESRYGIDLVEAQIAIAFGARLPFDEKDTLPQNWAMQVRINCEDPQNNFSPNSGRLTRYVSPGGPGIRLDSNLCAGYDFPSNYDSAGALLIAFGKSWERILRIMDRALEEYVISGIKTTLPFYRHILENEQFRSGKFDTNFVASTPSLFDYQDLAPEGERLTRLVAEITAKGYNPYVQLGQYRAPDSPRLPEFAPVLPHISGADRYAPNSYPRRRPELLEFLRDSKAVHFTDTTTRDMTQSNTGNRFRLAEDALLGPYLDSCNFFSLENGGGAHFHVAMLANMTYPFTEANEWNRFAPKTLKQLLVRSTNVLGYTPQPRNLMNITGEMICDSYHIVRCFDFLNDMRNMRPLAEVVLSREDVIFEPALSISVAQGFDIEHYLSVTEATLEMVRHIAGCTQKDASKIIILGLKDMAGICSPTFMAQLVAALRKRWPDLVLHYHRHATDGLFIPAVGAAAKAGAHIVDTGLGACVRTYGQGDILATVAYMENELGLKTIVNKDMIAQANFVLKQIMPYYDRYCSPYFQGTDYSAVSHCMPGGATSSSQEGAMKQGYIKLLPEMLRFLAAIRKIVRYHDVTPGSQITWNTAFLAITNAYKRQGDKGVQQLLKIAETAAVTPEDQMSEDFKKQRLEIYRDCNDAFRNLLLGKFGKLPLGFPEDWVYESAFGSENWRSALASRTEDSPLDHLADANVAAEAKACTDILKRTPNDEELVMYLNHPGDAIKTIQFVKKFGDPNRLPLDVWFEGLPLGRELQFTDSNGKPHKMTIFRISPVTDHGTVNVRYSYDSQVLLQEIKVAEGHAQHADLAMADPNNKYHVPAPSNGDLWVVYVKPGDIVKAGDDLFNISIMKQEKAVHAPVDGIVKRVLKTADYQLTRKMTPVREGELIIELAPCPMVCSNPDCGKPLPSAAVRFCPWCGTAIEKK